MGVRQQLSVFRITVAIGFAAVLTGGTNAAPIVYQGYDVGSTSLAASPNATTAAAAFDSATGTLSIIDFETTLPAGVSISGGGVIGDATVVCATPALHCYATSPINVLRNNGATFTFATPIDSFGAYFLGWQLAGQTITVGYLDGSTTILDMLAGNSLGGTLFFGFTDVGTSITSILYTAGISATDAVGIDDLRFGIGGDAPIPEPATLVLLGLGLAVGSFGRRRWRA